MIRTNLSTRPFYNERAVQCGSLVVAGAWSSRRRCSTCRASSRYSRSDTELATQASRDEARAADLRQQAARLRASVDPRQVEFASAEARQANDLIDRRTFSWTELFNRFETTLPDEVRITAVRPSVDHNNGIILRISVMAKRSTMSQVHGQSRGDGRLRERASGRRAHRRDGAADDHSRRRVRAGRGEARTRRRGVSPWTTPWKRVLGEKRR